MSNAALGEINPPDSRQGGSVVWNGRALPDVDYDHHPAYATAATARSLGLRLRATARFARAFAFTLVRRLIDYESLPLLSKDRTGGSRLGFAAAYGSAMLATHSRRMVQTVLRKRRPATANTVKLERFKADGFLTVRFDPVDIERLRTLSAPFFDELAAKRAAIPIERRKFDDNMRWVSRGDSAEIYIHVERLLTDAGILDTASAYLKRPIGVKYVVPQLNDDADTFWKRKFPDLAASDPKTTFMHVDTTYNLCKFMFYLTPLLVSDDGPFSYVRGTNNVRISSFEGLVRRANEYAGLSSKTPEVRRLFRALPHGLRKKCDFGNDMLDDQPEVSELLDNEVQFFSSDCDGILFDPNGVHRGGMVAQGERRVVTVLLAET